MTSKPRRIALSGGGMKGLAHVGALEVLQERGWLHGVREYCGTSAGALIALCICIGYTLQELRELCVGFDFTNMQTLDPDTVLAILMTFGLDSGQNLERLLRALLRTKGYEPDMTFGDLSGSAATPAVALRVYATDIETCTSKEFSATKTPRVPVRVAVAASMAVPLYFTPVRDPETGHLLVDGGLVAHFPFHHLTTQEREETLGIAFSQEHKYRADPAAGPSTLMEFILQLYYSVYHPQNERLYREWGHRILFLPCGAYPSLLFDSAKEQKEGLLAAGRTGAEIFFQNEARWLRVARPERRRSI